MSLGLIACRAIYPSDAAPLQKLQALFGHHVPPHRRLFWYDCGLPTNRVTCMNDTIAANKLSFAASLALVITGIATNVEYIDVLRPSALEIGRSLLSAAFIAAGAYVALRTAAHCISKYKN